MKKLIVVLIAAICLNGMAMAAGSPKIIKSKDKSFAVYYEDWNQTDLTVKLKDLSGYVLMTDRVKDDKVTGKKYNLRNLPEGDYVLEIANSQKMMSQIISLTDDSVVIDEENSKVFYSPNISVNDKKLDLNLLSLHKDVSVNIHDDAGNVIFSADLGSPLSVTERFDLSTLKRGDYAITVTQGQYQQELKFVL